ncbi:MAG: SRPBCC family protein [Planctomycetaceae bacterium]|nr:SRPBCC family protein [Planctomycetaceae bacterium]
MPAFTVERSIEVNASSEKAFDTVVDFGTWTTWSPWLRIDPDAVVTVSDDPRSVGSTYAWIGELVGQGQMTHTHLDRPSQMTSDLVFLKPFRSQSTVTFAIDTNGEQSRIRWTMNGSLPWFMFWMRPMMETYVGMDYERGLKMLKDLIETGAVHSTVEVLGIEDLAPRCVAGIRDHCSMNDIGQKMTEIFQQVHQAMPRTSESCAGEVLSVFHSVDLRKGDADFTGGRVVSDSDAPAAPLTKIQLPACRALHIRHVGSYHHLGNAWSGAHQYARHRKIKLDRTAACLEIYRNDPEVTSEADLVTDIYLPLK